MNRDWQNDLQTGNPIAVAFLPPEMVDETGWDILLMLHSDRRREMSLDRLASLASVPGTVMNRWLADLERSRLITGSKDAATGEVRAILTRAGRALLDRYLSAATDLLVGAQHQMPC